MDLSKVSKNDWIVVAGFVLMLIGVSLSWYHKDAYLLSWDYTGWHFFLTGIVPWLLTLVAVLLVFVKAIPTLNFTLPVPEALSVLILGAAAFVLVLIRLISGATISYGGLSTGVHMGRQWVGLLISLIATAVVAVGGFLKNAESAS